MVSYTSKTLIPGRPGTVKWVKKYGEALIYVRYRYDVLNKRKIKTVELIVEDEPWDGGKRKIPGNKIVEIKVSYGEVEIRRLVRQAGGKWNKEKKIWLLPYREVISLGLTGRMKKQESGCQSVESI